MSEYKNLSIAETDSLVKEIHFGVYTTFSQMFGIKPESAEHKIERDCSIQGDVSGIIALTQERNEGSLIVSFPKATICAMLTKMYRKEFTEVNHSVKAGVGELTNIIYGVVKTSMNKNGYGFKMAIPNVILGAQHTVVTIHTGPTLIMPFNTPVGNFSVLISFHNESADKAA